MSVKLLTSKDGTPLMAFGSKFFATTTGAPEPVKSSLQIEKVEDTVSIAGYECCAWDTNNNFPVVADRLIGKTVS